MDLEVTLPLGRGTDGFPDEERLEEGLMTFSLSSTGSAVVPRFRFAGKDSTGVGSTDALVREERLGGMVTVKDDGNGQTRPD